MASLTLAELAARLGGELLGDGTTRVARIAPLNRAVAGDIAFVADPKYLSQVDSTLASALILPPDAADASSLPRILTPNPYLYFARVSQLLNPPPRPPAGVAASARVAPDAEIAADACVGEGAVIAAGAVVGAKSVIGANCVVGEDAVIGADCLLYANVSVYHRCVLGDRVIVHSGAVIGADGFGFAPDGERWEKIPQIGRVVVGDDVEIGANTTIDRGALEDTVIEEGVKLDNLVHVAHNVMIGAHTAIAACTGIAGSAKIGRHCTIGGAAMIFGHIEIADGVRISTNTLITKSLPHPGTYTSALPFSEHSVWQKNAVQMRNLDKLAARVKTLEQKLAELENQA